MKRKSNSSRPAVGKAQSTHLARKQAALKEQLLKRRKRLGQRSDAFIDEAADLYDDGDYEGVCRLISTHLAQHPEAENIEALEMLGNAAVHVSDLTLVARAFRRLSELMPNEVHFQVNYAGALSQLALPYLTQLAFERLLKQWPNDPLVQQLHMSLPEMRAEVRRIYEKFPWNEDERFELALLHEEMLYGILQNDFELVIKQGLQLVARSPEFRPGLNNLAVAYRESRRPDEAVRLCREVLDRDPGNPHALVILGDSLYAQGDRRAAHETWERLRTLPFDRQSRQDCLVRQIEALSRLEDHAGVLEALAEMERRNLLDLRDPQAATALHLAAVAAARTGQHRLASEYWSTALECNPNDPLAQENREDHEQPEGMREGPWTSRIVPWLTPGLIEKCLNPKGPQGTRLSGEDSNEQFRKRVGSSVRQLAERLPELPDLVGDALRNSTPEWRNMTIMFCELSNLPALHERLREFALSPYGSDSTRMKAIMWLKEQGIVTDRVTLWSHGAPKEVLLHSAKIKFEPLNTFPPEVQPINIAAYQALQNHEFARAEKLYRECLSRHGDHPSLLMNMATAIDQQGRKEEAEALRNEIAERWPDYFFGRIDLFDRALEARDYERAKELLTPLIQREELHVSEYFALCFAYIDLCMSQGEIEQAQSWLDRARQLDPSHPGIADYAKRMQSYQKQKSWFGRLLGRLGGE